MHRISIFLCGLWLVMVCVSCAASEAPDDDTVTLPSQPLIAPIPWVFESAIAVRDEAVTALVGRLAEGTPAPPDLKIAFYDAAGDVLETVSAVTVQGTSSGLVYAAPTAPLTTMQQRRAIAASSAKAIVGPLVQPVYLGQARGTISEFNEGYRDPAFGYNGCPDCLAYYICHCLSEIDGVTPDLIPFWCSRFGTVPDESRSCEPITRLKPVPRN